MAIKKNLDTRLKNLGTRLEPRVRTPEEQRKHRAEQAARAILAGRGDWYNNWDRIEPHLRDLPTKRHDFMGLDIPSGVVTRCWPDPVALFHR
jgi:hypothetical protein